MAKIYRRNIVITISDTSRKELSCAGFNLSKIFVAKPAPSAEFEKSVNQNFPTKRKTNQVIYVGRLKKYKGIDVLIRAIGLLRQTLPVELLIVGKGDYENQLHDLVHLQGLDDIVKFSGFLDEGEKVLQLKTSSVFACCSIDEGGWTIAGLEAMRCGLPLVVTESQKDLVTEGLTGFIALNSASPAVIAEKIRQVLIGNWDEMSEQSLNFSLAVNSKESAKNALFALSLARKTI
jgi:glycosyltransferase involved in cell wall biosynthesis